jgi:hypothetical protein
MLCDGFYVLAGNATAPDQREPDFAIPNWIHHEHRSGEDLGLIGLPNV